MKKRVLSAVLVLCMGACLVACGDSKSDNTGATEAATSAVTEAPATEAAPAGLTIASTETWGDYTVGIPEGWTFRKGDAFSDTDTTCCSVKKSDFSYISFTMEKEDLYMKKYEQNKATYTNEQVDVSGKYGDIDWTGFQYSDGWGGYGFELYAKANNKPVRVSCAGFKFDSAEAKAVLESLKIK